MGSERSHEEAREKEIFIIIRHWCLLFQLDACSCVARRTDGMFVDVSTCNINGLTAKIVSSSWDHNADMARVHLCR
ncbi:MAG: hypothetical protein ACLVL2_26185, partial [Bacteroides cellulosilyticus]